MMARIRGGPQEVLAVGAAEAVFLDESLKRGEVGGDLEAFHAEPLVEGTGGKRGEIRLMAPEVDRKPLGIGRQARPGKGVDAGLDKILGKEAGPTVLHGTADWHLPLVWTDQGHPA